MAGSGEEKKSLVELAQEEFGPLGEKDTKFFEMLEKGQVHFNNNIITSTDIPKVTDTTPIDSEKVVWSLRQYSEFIPNEIAFIGVFIEGLFKIEELKLSKKLSFISSKIDNVYIINSSIDSLRFTQCEIEFFNIKNLTVKEHLVLEDSQCVNTVFFYNSYIEMLHLRDVKFNSHFEYTSFSISQTSIGVHFEYKNVQSKSHVRMINVSVHSIFEVDGSGHNYELEISDFNAKSLCDISHESWPAKITFDNFTYELIHERSYTDSTSRIKWLERMPQDRYRPQQYEQCAKVLANMGHEEDAKRIQIAKNEKRLKFKRDNLSSKPWKRDELAAWINYYGLLLYGKVTGYGYYPFRAAYYMALFVVAGWVIFYCGFLAGGMTASQASLLSQESNGVLPGTPEWDRNDARRTIQLIPDDYPHFQSLIYSLDTFIPLVDLHQESYWMPNSNAPGLGFMLWLYLWCHIFAGWILTTLLIAGLTGIFGRDR